MTKGIVTYTIHIDRPAVEAEFIKVATSRVDHVTGEIAKTAKLLAPFRTGRLKARIGATHAKRTGPWRVQGEAVSRAKYSAYVHDGTRPHIIRARRAAALHFFWPKVGREVFFRHVHHPGTRPRPFMLEAAEEVARIQRAKEALYHP